MPNQFYEEKLMTLSDIHRFDKGTMKLSKEDAANIVDALNEWDLIIGAIKYSAVFLNPLLVGLIAGSAESVGELSGYYLGYTGRDVLARSRLYQRLESWMRRRGWLLLFVVSLIPNPIFDVVGIAAGALRYPIWGFLAVVWVGKVLKFLVFAYACNAGADWLTGVFGL